MKRFAGLWLLFCMVCAHGARVVFVAAPGQGQLYDLRWGLAPLPGDAVDQQWGVFQQGMREDQFPVCAAAGSQIGVKIVWEPGDTPGPWFLGYSICKSTVSGQTFWFEGLSAVHGPNDTHWFASTLPAWVDRLDITGAVAIPQPSGLPTAPKIRKSIIFNVLGSPFNPMTPAWVNVLNSSTTWAYGATTAVQATTSLVSALQSHGTYNGGFNSYISTANDGGETFQLRRFLQDPLYPYGECNEFADYMVCMSSSLGALDLVSQRSNSIFGNVYFTFNTIDPAGTNSGNNPHRGQWHYHQIPVQPSANFAVWDGCLNFYPPTVPAGPIYGLARDTTYRGGSTDVGLVDHYNIGSWVPTPANGFIPNLTTN